MKRICYLGLGHFCVAMGFIGLAVPGIPGFVFFIIASWAYSRSSERFQAYLHQHPKIGGPLLAWEQHRVISKKAKWALTAMMLVSFGVIIWQSQHWLQPVIVGACILGVWVYLWTRPSEITITTQP
jgi:uncharacterized membrane protein YbaN (DUF454 family)